jgi:hypothetical protein
MNFRFDSLNPEGVLSRSPGLGRRTYPGMAPKRLNRTPKGFCPPADRTKPCQDLGDIFISIAPRSVPSGMTKRHLPPLRIFFGFSAAGRREAPRMGGFLFPAISRTAGDSGPCLGRSGWVRLRSGGPSFERATDTTLRDRVPPVAEGKVWKWDEPVAGP